jgi:hypothetical protein
MYKYITKVQSLNVSSQNDFGYKTYSHKMYNYLLIIIIEYKTYNHKTYISTVTN